MSYADLRDWLNQVEAFGELQQFENVDANLEMGALADVLYRESKDPSTVPALLFDRIRGYPAGYRALWGQASSIKRMALTMNMPLQHASTMEFIKTVRARLKMTTPVPPRLHASPLVQWQVREGEELNVRILPAPVHHELDGGSYLGSGCAVITRDPDEGWCNVGTYRVMVHDERTVGLYISPGKQGRIQIEKCHAQGQPAPVVICMGVDPALYLAANSKPRWGVSEFDWGGGLKGEPIDIVQSDLTGLPLPATAEIVLEGEVRPGDLLDEGPFGEAPGYYGGARTPAPVVRVQRLIHRDNPILTCSNPARPFHEYSFQFVVMRSAEMWDQLERANVPDVRGVYHPGIPGLNIVSINQRYAGHARQAAMIAGSGYAVRYVIVVDDDIDPSNLFDVMWAVSTRSDPGVDFDVIRKAWSTRLDPLIHPDVNSFYANRAIIDACRPFDWRDKFPPVAETSAELRRHVLDKYGDRLFGERHTRQPSELQAVRS